MFFNINKGNYIINLLPFFSKNFFDAEFQEYYKYIIKESKKGKIKEYEIIKSMFKKNTK